MAYGISNQHEAPSAMGRNIPYRGLEWHSPAIPDYLLYIFNISARNFTDPNNPSKGCIGRINLLAPGVIAGDPTEVTVEVPSSEPKGKPTYKVVEGNDTQPYHYITSFPQPILIPKFNDESNEIETKETDARRFVVDMISPDNLTLTLDATIDPTQAFSIGNDYAPRGIFFSLHNPPLQSDLQKAYARMEKYYTRLNEIAGTLEQTDKAELQRVISSNPDHLYAANYYNKPFAWAKKSVRPVECPNCGEHKPAGRLWHVPSNGGICVEQNVEAWKAVVLSGQRTRESVPPEFKWWSDEKVS